MASNQPVNRPGVSNDVQERTLKVMNIPENVTKNLLFELFLQCGPVRNVVHKPDFAFIEFESEVSVGYALALMDGVQLFGKRLDLQPKIPKEDTFFYVQRLKEYEYTFASQPQNWWARFGKTDGRPMPPHICSAVLNKMDRYVPFVPLPDIYRSSGGLNTSAQSEPSSSSRRGNHSYSHNFNSPSSSNFNNSQHHHQPHSSRSYQSLQPQPPIISDPPPRELLRQNDHLDNRRRDESSFRGSETYGHGGRSESEQHREDEAYYRRRQRDFNNRDGGYHRPDRRTDHSTYERYNPYSRPDHRQSYQQNQFHQQDPYHQPNHNYQQSSLQDERRNNFPTYRDNRFPSHRPYNRH